MITHEFMLDMTPNTGERPEEVNLNQGDTDYQLKVHLFASFAELNIESGTTAYICGTKPDSSSYSDAVSINDDIVTVSGDANMTDVAGRWSHMR